MAKRRGRFLRLLIYLIILFVVAAAALSVLPLPPLKPVVESRLAGLLGRPVTVDSVRLSFFGAPSLTIIGLTVQEDAAFDDGVFLKAEQATAGLDVVQSLRSRQIVLGSLYFASPEVRLVKNVNGVWSWATLGKSAKNGSPPISKVPDDMHNSPVSNLLIVDAASVGEIRGIKIDNGSVRLVDKSTPQSESLYRNVLLNATLARVEQGSEKRMKAAGELTVESKNDGEAEQLSTVMPFDLVLDRSSATGMTIKGSVGPGPLEARNVNIGSFSMNGEVHASKSAPMVGNGRIVASDMFLPTVNLGERVAGAFKIKEIGDMSPGTRIAGIETDFQIATGTITTDNLQIQQIDGLGDASAKRGDFKIESALTVNYVATILLSDHATRQVKASGPWLGMLTTIFETNNRLSVPLNINGDIRNPQVQIDITRIF
jgi:hypothetical protein